MIYRKLKHLCYRVGEVYFRLQYNVARLISPLVKKRYKNLWIISERGVDARDNSLHLFRYIRKNHPEIRISYIISRSSGDRKKVEALGPVIPYRSFRHMLAFVLSEVKISTHIMGFSPDMVFFRKFDRNNRIKGVKIFLQHGIIKDNLPYLYGMENNLDLFVCGAKKEWQYVHDTFGYREGIVRYLGLCRYDALPLKKEKPSHVILVMPTWRLYLGDLSQSDFKESEFYRFYQSLFDSPVLNELLERYGYRLKFYPHFNLHPYLKCFEMKNRNCAFADFKTNDIQDLLIEADLMITDYSSVFFDFAYMGKPVLYYQFDQEQFYSGHYQKGYFSYEQDGFGPVLTREDALLAALEERLAHGCTVEETYSMRRDTFFVNRDHENCKRNFEAILGLSKGVKD